MLEALATSQNPLATITSWLHNHSVAELVYGNEIAANEMFPANSGMSVNNLLSAGLSKPLALLIAAGASYSQAMAQLQSVADTAAGGDIPQGAGGLREGYAQSFGVEPGASGLDTWTFGESSLPPGSGLEGLSFNTNADRQRLIDNARMQAEFAQRGVDSSLGATGLQGTGYHAGMASQIGQQQQQTLAAQLAGLAQVDLGYAQIRSNLFQFEQQLGYDASAQQSEFEQQQQMAFFNQYASQEMKLLEEEIANRMRTADAQTAMALAQFHDQMMRGFYHFAQQFEPTFWEQVGAQFFGILAGALPGAVAGFALGGPAGAVAGAVAGASGAVAGDTSYSSAGVPTIISGSHGSYTNADGSVSYY